MIVDDETAYILRRANVLGIVDGTGQPNELRCSELISVCDLLSLVPVATPKTPPGPRLVFTAPDTSAEVEPQNRLDLLVIDVIRMANREVIVGGPYWNEKGFGTLLEVLTPAVEVRNVSSTFYVHTPSDAADSAAAPVDRLGSRISTSKSSLVQRSSGITNACQVCCRRSNPRRCGVRQSDLSRTWASCRTRGPTWPRQSEELCTFIEELDRSGLFSSGPAIV